MRNIIIFLIIIVCLAYLLRENFEDKKYIEFSKEKDYIYSIHDTKNNVYYDLVTLSQLDNEKQKKVLNYIKNTNSNIKNTLDLKFVSYNIEKNKEFDLPNNLLFAYPRKDSIPKIIVNPNNIIKFVINYANLVDEKTEFKFGTYDNTVILFKPEHSFNKKNNINITENNLINNVRLEKIDDLDLYQIKLADTSDFTLVKQ